MTKYDGIIHRGIAAYFTVTKGLTAKMGCLTSEELTSDQFQILMIMSKREVCTSTELSEVFQVGKSSITAMINRLVDRGFVDRNANPHDRRQIDLSLTESGKTIYLEAEAKLNNILIELFVHFSDEEIENFVTSYEKLAQLMFMEGSQPE